MVCLGRLLLQTLTIVLWPDESPVYQPSPPVPDSIRLLSLRRAANQTLWETHSKYTSQDLTLKKLDPMHP